MLYNEAVLFKKDGETQLVIYPQANGLNVHHPNNNADDDTGPLGLYPWLAKPSLPIPRSKVKAESNKK